MDVLAEWRIVEGGLDDLRVIGVLRVHVTTVRAQTAPDSAHALEVAGLQSPISPFARPFADYRPDPNSLFMTLVLRSRADIDNPTATQQSETACSRDP
jgi:hypothetical protein